MIVTLQGLHGYLQISANHSNIRAMTEVKRWIRSAEQAGWRVSSVAGSEIRLACAKHGCQGALTVSLNNHGPAPDPCGLDHVQGFAAAAFEDYRALVGLLIQRRMALGLDQADLNAILGMADGYIAKLECFARVTTIPTIQIWARALGVTITTGRAPLPSATAAAIQRRTHSPYRPQYNRSRHVQGR